MKFGKKLFGLLILLMSVFAIGTSKAFAASDATGRWGTVDSGIDWEFKEDSGTLTFTSGGWVPSSGENKSWFDTDATDKGQAIKKIVFQQPVSLTGFADHLFNDLANLESIDGLEKIDSSHAELLVSTFMGCQKLKNIDGLSNWDTSHVTSLERIFTDCYAVENFTALKDWNVSNVINLRSAFSSTAIENAKALEAWNTQNVTTMDYMFLNCTHLKSLDGLENWDTQNLKLMNLAFNQCENLENIDALRNWNTKNMVSMSSILGRCARLTNADALRNWNTENLTSAMYWFIKCQNLNSIDLTNWNTRSLESWKQKGQFSECAQLKAIALGENSVFTSEADLPEIDTSSGEYTGEWIGLNTGKIYSSSADFITNYDGTVPDTYVWRKTPTYNIFYSFVSDPLGIELPIEVTRLLPPAVIGDKNKTIVDSPVLTDKEIDLGNDTWIFEGWDKNQVTIEGADEQVVGKWQDIHKNQPDKPKPEEPEPVKPNPGPTNPSPDKPKPIPSKPQPDKPDPGKNTPVPQKPAPIINTNSSNKPINLNNLNSAKPSDTENKTNLPKTGDSSGVELVVIGFGFIIIVAIVVFYSQRRKK
ncbi:MAG: BspA family leucine-rich repeat surface protein [Streptococcaceae bacterium]|jgi:LPXTG-motif cell wall-anchored protein|nr:BspA family leucine-rich repeat surface protein [Streptococcaceae bacterium]